MELEVEITRLGAQGDAVAERPDGPIFVPFTLPGERVRVAVDPKSDHATLLHVLEQSAERVAPVCPHFGVCGGCALQHMEVRAYLRWKHDQVVAALRSRGLDAEVDEIRPVPLGSRRRASLTFGRGAKGPALGYHLSRSHELIGVEVCPVLSPRIVAALPKLRKALAPLVGEKREAKVSVTEIDNGLDIVVEGVRSAPAALAAFVRQAPALGVARLTAGGESITTRAAPEVDLSGVKVKLPPGTFLQASREAETVMTGLVREGVGVAKRVAIFLLALEPSPLPWRGAQQLMPSRPMRQRLLLSPRPRAGRRRSSQFGLLPATCSALRSGPRHSPPMTPSYSTRRGQGRQLRPRSLPLPRFRSSSPSPAMPERSRAISASW